MIPKQIKIKNKKLPVTPGVYLMKDRAGKILYIGKALNLKRRLESHFTRPHGAHIERMLREVRRIDYEETKNGLEALLREAMLIRHYHPSYNIIDQDDRSFLYVRFTREPFSRVLTLRGKERSDSSNPPFTREYGPFVHPGQLHDALKILRRIFKYSTHAPEEIKKLSRPVRGLARVSDASPKGLGEVISNGARPCFEYEIGLCPGTCAGLIAKDEYRKIIRRLISIFDGKRSAVAREFKHEMSSAAKNLDFETAAKLRRQIFALEHIRDTAFLGNDTIREPKTGRPFRIEGYDISNISGDSAVGSMVVFINGTPERNEYRKFGIKTVRGSNDTAMLREVIARRLGNPWPLPQLFLIDGGVPQVNAVMRVLKRTHVSIPVVGIAKGPERKRNDIIGVLPPEVSFQTAIRVRDEAHRFAIAFHKKRRTKNFLPVK